MPQPSNNSSPLTPNMTMPSPVSSPQNYLYNQHKISISLPNNPSPKFNVYTNNNYLTLMKIVLDPLHHILLNINKEIFNKYSTNRKYSINNQNGVLYIILYIIGQSNVFNALLVNNNNYPLFKKISEINSANYSLDRNRISLILNDFRNNSLTLIVDDNNEFYRYCMNENVEDLNEKTEDGWSAIYIVATNNKIDILKCRLDYSMDRNIKK
ncbi:hypothetical protein BCR32DRAFT_284668 [Anaeromyces robustus]|uniref:Uncharacterized protein n=1 Tax=Anaeromyces robustus TaxID=1754192 RepID=A0A1Y1WR19_9FUNG|nr:hypothetical protein BCR32DRAFT_284668 [Anaeromyces robustus]|eukprot:ORX75983.1 hypothetical protein BCR32DRAFT_284668 [Anaeromyces robustus]